MIVKWQSERVEATSKEYGIIKFLAELNYH